MPVKKAEEPPSMVSPVFHKEIEVRRDRKRRRFS
jgi:hypothetical protein